MRRVRDDLITGLLLLGCLALMGAVVALVAAPGVSQVFGAR